MTHEKQGEYNKKWYDKKKNDEEWMTSRRNSTKTYWEKHPEKYEEHKAKMREQSRKKYQLVKKLMKKYEEDTSNGQ